MEKTETTANENDLSVRDSSFWNGLLEMEAIFGLAPSGPDPCETPDSQAPPEPEPSEAADSRELTKSDTSKTVESLEPSIKYSTKAPDFSASAASSSKEKRPGKIHFPGRSFGDTFLDPMSSRPPAEESRPHLRTAAYCRVSTASDEQDQSIQSQKEHYEYLVSLHEDWHLVSIYYEAGVSGTGTQDRPELQRLLSDCQAGHIDLILTKSISRFARNTIECIAMTRWLIAHGVHIYFEKEGIHTGTMQSELFLSVLASIAESESHSISANTRWACQKRFQDGTYLFSVSPYGYKLTDGDFHFHEEEQDVMQRVYELNLQGYGSFLIAKILNQSGTPRRNTTAPWDASVVKKLLQNPFYCGDVLFQKTYTDDYFQRHYNYGHQSQVYIKDHHPGLINHDTYMRTQELKAMRRRQYKSPDPSGKNHGSKRSCLSGRLHCPCGCSYQRTTVNQSVKRHFWVCRGHRLRQTNCQAGRLLEEDLQNIFTTLMNKLYFSRNQLLKPFLKSLKQLQKSAPPADQYQLNQNLQYTSALLQDVRKRKLQQEFNPRQFRKHVDYILIRQRPGEAALQFHMKCGLQLTEYLSQHQQAAKKL